MLFHEVFDIGIYIYTKSMKFCVTWRFYIQKFRHFEKSTTVSVTFFIYKKSDTLRYAIFHGIFKLAEGGGVNKKQCTLRKFLFAKNNALSVTFFNTKSLTLCVTFLYAKINQLCVTFLYVKFIASNILIPKYKYTYDQSDQIDKYIRALCWELVLFLL